MLYFDANLIQLKLLKMIWESAGLRSGRSAWLTILLATKYSCARLRLQGHLFEILRRHRQGGRKEELLRLTNINFHLRGSLIDLRIMSWRRAISMRPIKQTPWTGLLPMSLALCKTAGAIYDGIRAEESYQNLLQTMVVDFLDNLSLNVRKSC